jgi:hypothetical protein
LTRRQERLRLVVDCATTGSKVAFVKDPAGNEIELTEEK